MRGRSKYVFHLLLMLALFTLVSSNLGLFNWVYIAQTSPGTPNTGTIVYGEGALATPRYRRWDGTNLGSEQTGPTMEATIRYAVFKSNPMINEKMLVVSDDSGDVSASVLTYGAEWGTVKTLGTAILSDTACRGFHVAYEQSSGDCMIVVRYLTDVKYWIWDGLSWTVDGATLDLTVTTANPVWIRLAPDPGSDEIAMIWLDDTNRDVGGAIWDGSAWGHQQLLESTDDVITTEMLDKECIAVEYMANNGKAMFTWGADNQPTTSDCAIGTRVWNGASWDAQAYIMYAAGRDNYPPFWLSLKADPNSNQLMLAVTDDDTDTGTIRWSGTAWDSVEEHSAGIETEGSRCVDVEWENVSGHSGHAIVAWGEGGDHVLSTKHWDGSSWGSVTTAGTAELSDIQIVQLRRTGDGKIFVSMVDDGSGLHVWYWSSASAAWTTSGNGLGEVETSVSALLYEPFEFAPDSIETLPSLYITPPSIVNHNLGVGQTFYVEVKVADYVDLFGVEFKLAYNTSILTATNIDDTGNIFIDGQGSPDSFVWVNSIDDTAGAGGPGKGLAWLSLTDGVEAYGVDGSGLVGKVTFSVDARGESDLEFIFTEIVDSATIDIPSDLYEGYFANAALVRIDPFSSTVNGTVVSTFYIDVTVTWAINLLSYEFNVTYNTDILTASDVLQGDIFSGQPLSKTINDAQGWVWANSTRLTGFTGKGTLAQIAFKPDYIADTSPLHFFQADLTDGTGSIPTAAYDGSVSLIGSTVSVSPQYQLIDTTFTFTSNITVTHAVYLYTWKFNLTYDTTILTATGVTEGPFLQSGGTTSFSSTINDGAGWIWANATLTGAVLGVNGTGVLATISFYIDAAGGSDLSLQEAKLRKPLGVRLPSSTIDGIITAAPPAIPEFPLGAAVEIAIAAVIAYVWLKRRGRGKTSRTNATRLR